VIGKAENKWRDTISRLLFGASDELKGDGRAQTTPTKKLTNGEKVREILQKR